MVDVSGEDLSGIDYSFYCQRTYVTHRPSFSGYVRYRSGYSLIPVSVDEKITRPVTADKFCAQNSNLSKCTMKNVRFSDSDFTRADMSFSQIEGTSFSHSKMGFTNFIGTKLTNKITFPNCSLENVIFIGTGYNHPSAICTTEQLQERIASLQETPEWSIYKQYFQNLGASLKTTISELKNENSKLPRATIDFIQQPHILSQIESASKYLNRHPKISGIPSLQSLCVDSLLENKEKWEKQITGLFTQRDAPDNKWTERVKAAESIQVLKHSLCSDQANDTAPVLRFIEKNERLSSREQETTGCCQSLGCAIC